MTLEANGTIEKNVGSLNVFTIAGQLGFNYLRFFSARLRPLRFCIC